MNYKESKKFVKCYKVSDKATIPTRATDGSAGLDLYCVSDVYIPPNGMGGKTTKVSHDIRFEFPDQKCYGRIAARSGLAANHSLIVLGGVVDNDYW